MCSVYMNSAEKFLSARMAFSIRKIVQTCSAILHIVKFCHIDELSYGGIFSQSVRL